MGDMYAYDKNSCSSSTSASQPQLLPSSSSHAGAPDEISLFLHQILLRSSSSSSPFVSNTGKQAQLCDSDVLPGNPHRSSCRSALVQDGISAVESSSAMSTGSGVFLSNLSTSSLGASENETDEYDCESEEGLEALVEDVSEKPIPPRSSSKRSRAAEVHNLSEKRRRSRINEKMKALQNLIPNSNKTDKASMLDEAIEYLKQLQLQVQMLSMRNGFSLHPMCLPGALQPIQFSQMRMDFGEEYRPLHLNTAGIPSLNKETPLHDMFTLPNQRIASNQPSSAPNMSSIINSQTSFGLESPVQAHLGPFQLHVSSEEICRGDALRHQEPNVNNLDSNPLEMGATASVSLPFNTQASELKDSGSLETCIPGRVHSEGVLLKKSEHNLVLTPHISMHRGRSSPKEDAKMEKPNF
ncbi:hypothetical protein I3843_01G016000 [Carya illinoinensis]|uniref:BHLH domain-containing protein n=1 Tax=Carya illinoinensis TaxID=32201 RepID=A0A8T1RHZ4_CARIL|nr:transcription factor SPATULA [Carya illinoinensis]KAG6666229.1 hypothetical protein CIPAW_01G016500 [Carya illinoinensis]KAG7993677.1 hypothetical protein I3843_01G016000 [Carya illinoinensis]